MKISSQKNTKRKKRSNINAKKLWNLFDNEMNREDVSKTLERVYSSNELSIRDKCELCGSNVSFSEEKFLICTNRQCGIIYKDTLDASPEWRYYGGDDNKAANPTRCGMPINPLLKESSYGCKVLCNGRSTYEMRKVRRYTEWQSMPYKEKSQYDEFERIKLLANNANVPKVIIDEALRIHKKISQEQRFRGLNRAGVIAASIYVGSRMHHLPRTAKEIATMFHLDNSSATKGCKNAVAILNKIEKGLNNLEKTQFYETKPIDFIDRYCSKLRINKELTRVCQFVATRIQRNNLMPENTPHSVAAGIVYFVSVVCNLNITKKDVNIASEISEVTINKCYKKLAILKTNLIPSSILTKYSL
jgi:transcription initiation factor TFIIB